MAVDYTNTFTQLGAEMKVIRKTEALWVQSHFSSDAAYSKRLLDSSYSSSNDNEDNAQSRGKIFLEDNVTPSLTSLHSSQVSSFEDRFFPVLDDELDTSQTDIDAGAISYIYTVTGSGEVSIKERTGRLGALRRQMITDSKEIQENTVSLGALATIGTNTGVLSLTTATGEDHCLPGNILLEVINDTVGATTFSVQLKLTTPIIGGDKNGIINADNALTLGQTMEDGWTGATLKVDLGSVVEAGDNGNFFSSTTITSAKSGDTDNGKIYIKVSRQATAPIWLIEYYSDGSLSTLEGTQTADGTSGTVAVSITGSAGTVFASTFSKTNAHADMASAPDSDSDITFDIVNPRLGDRWKIPVTNNEGGNFATKLARTLGYRASLSSDGSPTETDSLAASASFS